MANTKLPARLLDTSAVPALNVTGDLTVDTTTLKVDSSNNRVGIGTDSPNAFLSVRKDNNNSGNQFVVADTEGATPGVRTYTHNGDDSGLILNHYYAVGGSSNEYMRYADFVANVGNGAGTTMRFITKNAANTFTTGLVQDNNGNVGIGTTSPSFTAVSGSTSQKGLHIQNSGNDTSTHLKLTAHNNTGTPGQATDFEIIHKGDALQTLFRHGGADVLTVDSSGNVGIGNTSPTAKLDLGTNGVTRNATYDVSANAYISTSGGAATNTAASIPLTLGRDDNASTGDEIGLTYNFDDGGWSSTAGVFAKVESASTAYTSLNLRTWGGGWSTGMTVTSAGAVTKPAQPSFNVNEPAVTSGGNTVIFGSERHDTGSNYDTSTGIFTAPVAGVYQFHVYILMSPGNNQYGRILFRINNVGSNMEKYGDTLTYAFNQPNYFALGLSANIYMAATDNIRVYNAGQWPTYGTSYGSFSGMLIG